MWQNINNAFPCFYFHTTLTQYIQKKRLHRLCLIRIGINSAVFFMHQHAKFFKKLHGPFLIKRLQAIRPFPGYLSTTGESIRKNVAEHINGLNIGDDVSLSRLYSPANAANAASYDIESITLGTSQGAQSAANVAVAFNAVASCSVDRVKLVVRP